jgi:hypothetical protein
MFSASVKLLGMDEQGQPFEATGRTVTVNRHGARIQVAQPLKPSQIIRVINHYNQHSADFRVVGPVSPPAETVGEWAIECLGEKDNIWDIYFPLPEESSEARALLQCRHCHAFSLQPLSLAELEVLDTAGLLSRRCTRCKAQSLWGYPLKKFELENLAAQAVATSAGGSVPVIAERRRAPRSLSQIPARIRDYYGGSEIVQTENVSKHGFCYVTNKKYYVGQGIMVACPFGSSGEISEVLARIVREQSAGTLGRHLYAVRYDEPAESTTLPRS